MSCLLHAIHFLLCDHAVRPCQAALLCSLATCMCSIVYLQSARHAHGLEALVWHQMLHSAAQKPAPTATAQGATDLCTGLRDR